MNKLEQIYKNIENFDSVFGDDFIAPEYAKAWELNKNHGIKLNHLPKESALYIQNLIKENKPKIILEIGTSGAYSTLHMAKIANEYGGKVITIEKSAPKAEIARVHIRESGLDNIELMEEKAEEVFKKWDKPLDMLFLDADRKKYKEFLITLEPHLSPSAIIIADNVENFKDEVQDFLNYIKQNPQYASEILPLPNGLLIAKSR